MEIEEETKPIIFNSTSSAIKEKKRYFRVEKKKSKLKKIIIHPKQKQFENLKK